MELVTLAIFGVALVVSAAIAAAVKQYDARRKAKEEADSLRQSLEQYSRTYSFEVADNPMINACREYLSERFPDGIEQEYNKLDTLEDRKHAAEEVVRDLALRMGVEVDSIEFSCMEPNLYGKMHPGENGTYKIYLNEAVLVADPKQLVKTICHELRHIVQIKSLTDNKWGYSSSRVAQWLYSWNNYVSCTSYTNYLAYNNQIIEVDADKFADELFKDLML